MPRNMDWKDYIPASGEAHAQIGLKGRFGKGSNKMRFRRGGSFARTRRRINRKQSGWYWEPYFNNGFVNMNKDPGDASFVSSIFDWAPQLGVPVVGHGAEQYDEDERYVLGYQGHTSFRAYYTGNPTLGSGYGGQPNALDSTSLNFDAMSQWEVWYLWKIADASGQGLFPDTQAEWQRTWAGASAGEVFARLMHQKDIIHWGVSRPLRTVSSMQMLPNTSPPAGTTRIYGHEGLGAEFRISPPKRIFPLRLGRYRRLRCFAFLQFGPMPFAGDNEPWLNKDAVASGTWDDGQEFGYRNTYRMRVGK